MNRSLKRIITLIVPPFVALFGTLVADSPDAAVIGPPVHPLSMSVMARRADPGRILGVLELKMGGSAVPGKVKDKLLALPDAQIRLVASLSDRMANKGHTPSADIAFLLIAALIILS